MLTSRKINSETQCVVCASFSEIRKRRVVVIASSSSLSSYWLSYSLSSWCSLSFLWRIPCWVFHIYCLHFGRLHNVQLVFNETPRLWINWSIWYLERGQATIQIWSFLRRRQPLLSWFGYRNCLSNIRRRHVHIRAASREWFALLYITVEQLVTLFFAINIPNVL